MYLLENPKQTFHLFMLSVLTVITVQTFQPWKEQHIAQQIGHSLDKNNEIVQHSNERVLEEMRVRVETKKQFEPLYETSLHLQEELDLVSMMVEDIQRSFRKRMSQNPASMGLTRQFFITEGNAEKLKYYLKMAFESLTYNIQTVQKQRIPGVKITDGLVDTFKLSLPINDTFNIDFEQLTPELAGAFLSNLLNDIASSQSVGINFLNDKMGRLDFCCGCGPSFFATSTKPYVVLGQPFTAEMGLGGFSSQAKFSVMVDGQRFPVKEGKARFSQKPTTLGEHSYRVQIWVRNPKTGVDTILEKTFFYEVGDKSEVVVQTQNAQTLYKGIENIITLSHPNFELKIPNDATLRPISNTQFALIPSKKGRLDIQAKHPKTKQHYTFSFKVENAPLPQTRLAANTETGLISAAQMQQQRELQLEFKDTDFAQSCQVKSFAMTYLPKREDAQIYENIGAKFNTSVQNAVKLAKTGDQYAFTDIQVRCLGDPQNRETTSLAFVIQ